MQHPTLSTPKHDRGTPPVLTLSTLRRTASAGSASYSASGVAPKQEEGIMPPTAPTAPKSPAAAASATNPNPPAPTGSPAASAAVTTPAEVSVEQRELRNLVA